MLFDFLYGVNTITSLLNINAGHRKIYEIVINSTKLRSSRITEIIQKAKVKNISIHYLNPKDFINYLKANITGQSVEEGLQSSQGIIAKTSQYNYSDFGQALENELKDKKDGLLVILDEITDVGNFGSILRNCSAFAVDGVIISKNRCVSASTRVSKISSGAMEELKIFVVVNIANTIERLKGKGFWIYGTTVAYEQKAVSADEINYTFPLAVVFGSEEKGIGSLIKKKCDYLITVKTSGIMKSLNVSSASAVTLFIIRHFQKGFSS